jgi:hypothetical protein
VYPENGGYGSRPMYVARTGGGWHASCKLPPGLSAGWHTATLRTEGSRHSTPLRIGIDNPPWRPDATSKLVVTRIADGKTFELNRVHVGEESAISVWVAGLPTEATQADVKISLNGTDLPAIWLDANDTSRQINALLPSGLAPGKAVVSVVFNNSETKPTEIELCVK